ncbi:transcription termination factor 5, mitochondrial-like isoform X2 [Ctenocephalides felis]|uniref:transcription termination factor 5, mitochondrial-like isoform X2 n=1 Tax=Ctenocephalides felis TaxID=7515 RepID=UPI000E6E414A|nr:transcription termination factor 5, mitochondrial-like isoform X2 [Ctenocephalides felis]
MFLRKSLFRFESFGWRYFSMVSDESLAINQFNSQNVKFFMNKLGLTKQQTYKMFAQYPNLHTRDLNRLANAHKMLLRFGFSIQDLKNDPNVLTILPGTIEQHYIILQESGFNNITTTHLRSFLSLGRRPISLLKAYRFIDDDLVVHEHLLKSLDSEFKFTTNENIDDSYCLNTIRQIILHEYLKWYLQISDAETNYLFKTYSRIKNKSFQIMRKSLKQLDEIGLTKEKIKRNGFLLHSHPENIEKMLSDVRELAGLDIREVIKKLPKIALTNYETLLKTDKHLKDFNISNEAIRKCWDIYTLGSDTVHERLQDLVSIPEFKVLASHPRIVRLIHYQKKALSRLSYLQEMKVKCASLHVLSSTRNEFEKYAREGADRTKGKDLIAYLMSELQLTNAEIREKLNRHNYWCHVPVVSAEATLNMLKQKSFLNTHLINNIHILLYPKAEVERILEELSSSRTHSDLPTITDLTQIDSNKILALCMYILEKKHHFTGNGIWDDQAQL